MIGPPGQRKSHIAMMTRTKLRNSWTFHNRNFLSSRRPRKRCNKDFAWSLVNPGGKAKWIRFIRIQNRHPPLKMRYIFETMPIIHVSKSSIFKFSKLSPPGNANETISNVFFWIGQNVVLIIAEHVCCDFFTVNLHILPQQSPRHQLFNRHGTASNP